MLMNKPEKQIKSNSDKKKTPTPVISGYTKEEMEEIYSFAQSLEDGPRIEALLSEWYKEGSLKFKADVTIGLENVLVAYKKIFTGENIGKTLVKL